MGWELNTFNACLILISIPGSSLGHRGSTNLFLILSWQGHSPISGNMNQRDSRERKKAERTGVSGPIFLKKRRE